MHAVKGSGGALSRSDQRHTDWQQQQQQQQQQHYKGYHVRKLMNSGRLNRHHNVSVLQSGSNPVITGLVSAMTESLRVLGIGQQQYQQIAQQPSQNEPLAAGDVQGVMGRIAQDYQQAYFVTGVIDDSIYDKACTFVDPTVQFSGLDLWKRNLQLLVPFLIEPRIELLSMSHLGKNSQGAEQVKAEWTLDTVLALPWRPRVSILGSTVYTLSPDGNKVVRHVESWNVSAAQALLQIVTPGKQH